MDEGAVPGSTPSWCIYCRGETSGKEGEAHILPEAVAQNDLVLPRGAVCSPCNQYLSELDTALATHPLLAFGIQALALPGKSGKARLRLGLFEQSGDSGAQELTLMPGAVDRVTTVEGRSIFILKNPDLVIMRRFHRALHHVAFNFFARVAGCAEALRPIYDPARRYIRSPMKKEVWPYFASSLGPNPMDIIDLFCLHTRSQVLLRFFNHMLAVDLLRGPTLAKELQRLFPTLEWQEVTAQ